MLVLTDCFGYRKQISSTVEELVQRTGKYMQLERMHEEESGYDVNLQVVTVRLPPEEEGQSEEEEKNKVRALLNFGQHGREHITVEVVLAFLQQLSEALLMKEPWVSGIACTRSSLGTAFQLPTSPCSSFAL